MWAEALSGADVVSGFASMQSEPFGWNAIVRYGTPPTLKVANETLTISWQAGTFSSYAPRSPETVTLSLPAEAVRSRTPLTIGQLVITVDPGSVDVQGALVAHAMESDLRSAESHTLDITLHDDTWLPSVGLDSLASAALLNGLVSAQQEPNGWNTAVRPLLTSADLTRLDAQTVRLTIPQRAGYDISQPETITLTVPPAATFSLRTR